MAAYVKPLPEIEWPMAREFWAGCKRHELLLQQCQDCGKFRWYPQPMCPHCHSMNVKWTRSNGSGKVYSYVITRRAFGEAWHGDVPFTIAVVELDDVPGVRLMANVVRCNPDDVSIGMTVEVVFDDVTDDVTLPRFAPSNKVR